LRGLPAELIAELVKECHFQRHLYKFSFSSILRYTDADIDIYYGGYWWLSRGIEFDAAKYSASPRVDNITLDIDDVDRTFKTIVLSEEIRGKECLIYKVALDKNMAVLGASILFLGYCDAFENDNQRHQQEVFNHFIRWKMLTPRHIHGADCRVTFKSTRCGYTGAETWCDHSWERCVVLSNKINFRGFRWLPYLIEKPIWWGRAPT
jgi:hypothetical protein